MKLTPIFAHLNNVDMINSLQMYEASQNYLYNGLMKAALLSTNFLPDFFK